MKNKPVLKKIIISRIWLAIISVVVLVLFFNASSLFIKRYKVWKKVEQLKKEKEVLVERKKTIEFKNTNLDNDKGKEAIYRERFNVIKPGEQVIIITEPNEDVNVDLEVRSSVWQKIKNFFKKEEPVIE